MWLPFAYRQIFKHIRRKLALYFYKNSIHVICHSCTALKTNAIFLPYPTTAVPTTLNQQLSIWYIKINSLMKY